MPATDILIKGAREHNLRNVDVILPRNRLICLTGVSGSGKSSLAFDTLYAEGQRRYVESLSTFARQFLGQMPKPEVDFIGGLSPSISISQKSTGSNPRSTVGTVTEIHDYLRVLYARVGQGHCPRCDREIAAQTQEQIIARILTLPADTKYAVLAPIVRRQKGEYRDLFVDLLKQGFVRARVDGQTVSLNDDLKLDRQMRHDIEVVVDRLQIKSQARARLAEAVELALKVGKGTLIVETSGVEEFSLEEVSDLAAQKENSTDRSSRRANSRPNDIVFSIDYACSHCGISFQPPSPQLFSFNSPQGMCLQCDGLGDFYSFDPDLLIPDPNLSFQQGCFELIGPWKELGRWRRHIYQGVADTIERLQGLAEGTLLETSWSELPAELQNVWLTGTGERHITFTWRGGSSPIKYGGRWDGIVPDLLGKYRTSKSFPQRRQLEKYMRTLSCPLCHGQRLNDQARAVRVTTANPRFSSSPAKSLPEVSQLAIGEAVDFFSELQLDATRRIIAAEVLKEIRARLGFLLNVGLDYLTLARTAPTLSGGESQRIRLAGQIGSGLVGVLYILDEPSIGLHPRDNGQLLDTLHHLRDMGNTVVVVEHDEDTMRAADHLIDFGPGPGIRGGEVVVAGPLADVVREPRSVTGRYLSGRETIDVPIQRRMPSDKRLRVFGAAHNNLKQIDVDIPLGTFVCVTGVSGSGKSSFVNDILVEALLRDLNGGEGVPGKYDRFEGLEHLDKMIAIDQSPIGRTPRSNPGTYIKVFDDIRQLFSQLPTAKLRGYEPGRFSFNVTGGRCEACEGNGSNRLEMDFLADVWVTCPVCAGHRYNRETLQVKFKDRSIAEVLEMDIQQLLELFENVHPVRHKLQTLHDVGLDYVKLGQPSPTLSGGEAQRIKLAKELVKKSTGRTLYLLDEPTTGLHFADIKLLLKVLHDFVDAGNTVLVVEHNLDVIKTADWLIDLGPEGGEEGGRIVAVGTPEQVAAEKASYTGRALRRYLGLGEMNGKRTNGRKARRSASNRPRHKTDLVVRGASQHNLKGVDIAIPRDQMTVFCGPSGSGKSSLAMDTIYAEGQRRYVESLSSYARQFVSQMQKPQLDHIDGLSPAIAIEQKNLGNTPRSTVGTVTEIYDYLRVLFARLGQPHCPACELPIGTQTIDEILDKMMAEPDGTRLYLLAPVDIAVGDEYEALWTELKAAGYARVRIDGEIHTLDKPPEIDRRRKHDVQVVVDRIVVQRGARSRIADSVETALALGKGVIQLAFAREGVPEAKWPVIVHSQHLACGRCGRSFEPLSPHNFSYNSQLGWCPACEGLGVQTGANPAALLRDPKLTLGTGAVSLWPNLDQPVSRRMLEAFCAGTGIPIDVPFEQLAARYRRMILHGTGDQWFEFEPSGKVPQDDGDNPRGRNTSGDRKTREAKKQTDGTSPFRFQFKGLYPALEEASRLSPSFRARLAPFVGEVECSTCNGSRLRDDATAVRFRHRTLDELCRMPLGELQREIEGWKLPSRDRKIIGELLREIGGRVQFLNDVGLDYLSLGRGAATLSNGEAQRIRLASQLGSGLCGVLYVLDEPTIGLHPRDNTRLLKALHKLRDLGNTLIVVEHDREVISGADSICDFGPGAGRLGGQVVAQAPPELLGKRRGSVTGPYLNGKKAIPVPAQRRLLASDQRPMQGPAASSAESDNGHPTTGDLQPPGGGWLEIRGARHNNLQNVDVRIPLGTLTAVTGPSGSGKSSLVEDVLYNAVARTLHRAGTVPGAHDEVRGLEFVNKVIRVDQQALGNSPTSNPATYTGVFELIRQLYAQLPEAKVRGYTGRRFSFNVPGGRCEACEGNGQTKIEMHFLPDVWVQCETCRGKRYNPETLAVTYHGRSISDVLDMTCADAVRLFENIAKIRRILQTLCDVGLDYLTLGQPAPTLSGGEAQRVKLAAELSRPDTGRTLYLLDEPTTGLHFDDLVKLLEVLQRLVDLGNSVVVIEHNLDVIKAADWIIDMGPEAGEHGGQVVVAGTPEDVVRFAELYSDSTIRNPQPAIRNRQRSYTAEALRPVLAAGPRVKRLRFDPATLREKREGDLDITQVGRDAKMPWQIDGRAWHTRDRVGRGGEPCRWDGRILDRVIDRIHELGEYSDTNWDARSVVEISAKKKSDGWFFHAITGETWLLKMKFRVYRGTFQRDALIDALNLKTLNQLDEVPMYGNEPRVKVRAAGPWQEVEVRTHSWDEIDTPEFWKFLEDAVTGFFKFTERAATNMEDLTPWKVLGQKWHFLRKGFPPNKSVQWDAKVWDELYQILCRVLPNAQFLWNNQQVVRVYVLGDADPWASVWTKRPEALILELSGPKGAIALGRVTELGFDRELEGSRSDRDVIKLKFRTLDDLCEPELTVFLNEHLSARNGVSNER